VTIKGTVADGFSVVAVKDVEILGTIGIGSVKEVVSKRGASISRVESPVKTRR